MTRRHICTAADPWTPDKGRYAGHPDAREVWSEDGYPGGDVATFECPNCNHRFKVEMPQ